MLSHHFKETDEDKSSRIYLNLLFKETKYHEKVTPVSLLREKTAVAPLKLIFFSGLIYPVSEKLLLTTKPDLIHHWRLGKLENLACIVIVNLQYLPAYR